MKKCFLIILSISLFCLSVIAQNNLKLWYEKPASDWNQALPLGNGRLGVMVFGSPNIEQLQLNEETIWAGSPNSNSHKLDDGVLEKVRNLVFEGKYEEAQDIATAKIMSPKNHGMPYQTMGDFFIAFNGHDKYTNYYRELDIAKAIATTSYEVNGVIYTREVFCSFTDQAILVKLSASEKGKISCNAFITTPHEKPRKYTENDQLIITATTPAFEKQSGKVQFETRVKPRVIGGTHTIQDNTISINNADEAYFYISIATNFVDYQNIKGDKSVKSKAYMDKAFANNYSKAKQEHISFFQQYMNRSSLDLGTTQASNKPTDQRIKEFSNSDDPALVSLYYQFGRYLLISCSQPETQPANLQGIWNDRYLPSWDSKYTTNINIEMNYWPAEVTNLSEMHEPMLKMIRELSESGKKTAQEMYNCRGWVLHHNTDIWRITAPVDRAASGMWPTGGAWISQHLWYRYLQTGDLKYLEEIYPIMRESAMFFNDFLITEPEHGWLVVSPSNSPENTHAGSNNKATISAGTTMDNQLLLDLFCNVITASELLNIDKAFADTLRTKRDLLPPMQIGKYNQLQEWMSDWDSPEDKHRHVSHLYGLYPSNQISPIRTPELFEAAKNSLIYRGDPSTGWSMGWKVCLWARLLDGNHAFKLLINQLDLVTDEQKKGGTYSNMFDAHPPFQIDGNFGCTAGIAEMLMQSHDGSIYILPALPDVWKDGKVKGLVARGGFIIDIDWKDGKAKTLKITSQYGGNCRIRIDGKLSKYDIKKAKGENLNRLFETPIVKEPLISSQSTLKTSSLNLDKTTNLYDLKTEKGKTYTFSIK